jgi:hypothetical protein
MEKSSPNMWDACVIFQVNAQIKQSPNSQKFAQSGHPGLQRRKKDMK